MSVELCASVGENMWIATPDSLATLAEMIKRKQISLERGLGEWKGEAGCPLPLGETNAHKATQTAKREGEAPAAAARGAAISIKTQIA